MKTTAKSPETKRKTKKSNVIVQETATVKETVSFGYILMRIFKIVTLPLYMIYVLLFKIPTDGPAPMVGFLRFSFFVFIGMNTYGVRFEHMVNDYTQTQSWLPSGNVILGFYAIILLWNLFLSFFEIWGLSTGSYWYDPFENASNNSVSGYDAIEEGIDYRDALLRADHTPGKIAELKKTGFMTKGRLAGLGSSPEVDSALELLNSQMRNMHRPDKLRTLKEMFGGAKS